ncbi:hypothetical protein C1882_06800 [Pseudomonas sp. FW305-E2]|nr:hypothetical protein C1882_06800 [Pseudomonas sp. FW305-E2]QNV65376.1 hypothetical protein F7661_05005 [Pseudomonas sp. CFA]
MCLSATSTTQYCSKIAPFGGRYLLGRIKVYSKPQEQRQQDDDQQAELRKLRAELKRVTEERDFLAGNHCRRTV